MSLLINAGKTLFGGQIIKHAPKVWNAAKSALGFSAKNADDFVKPITGSGGKIVQMGGKAADDVVEQGSKLTAKSLKERAGDYWNTRGRLGKAIDAGEGYLYYNSAMDVVQADPDKRGEELRDLAFLGAGGYLTRGRGLFTKIFGLSTAGVAGTAMKGVDGAVSDTVGLVAGDEAGYKMGDLVNRIMSAIGQFMKGDWQGGLNTLFNPQPATEQENAAGQQPPATGQQPQGQDQTQQLSAEQVAAQAMERNPELKTIINDAYVSVTNDFTNAGKQVVRDAATVNVG